MSEIGATGSGGGTAITPFTILSAKYKNAYDVATSLKGVGGAYKLLSVVVAAGGVAGAFMSGSLAVGIPSFMAGVVFGGMLFGTGLLLQALGETLGAVLDTAVNTRASAEKAWEAKP